MLFCVVKIMNEIMNHVKCKSYIRTFNKNCFQLYSATKGTLVGSPSLYKAGIYIFFHYPIANFKTVNF